ncbi:hypothetical protein [Candidatus Avelusimicrobium fimicolum]|uniref:hypothetical protein n=1 Tax=Candidatus Avelusimicrobium fimicolum TaxID=3416216 RepID=UPI003D12FFC0
MTKRYLKTPEEVIDALQAGKVVSDDEGYIYKMYKGVIFWRKKEQWYLAPTICNDYGLYVEYPNPLKLEVGKFYKTRDGRKAWLVSRQQDEHFPYVIAVLGKVDAYAVTKYGRFYDDKPYAFDIVAPWEE